VPKNDILHRACAHAERQQSTYSDEEASMCYLVTSPATEMDQVIRLPGSHKMGHNIVQGKDHQAGGDFKSNLSVSIFLVEFPSVRATKAVKDK